MIRRTGEWDTEPNRVDFEHAGFSCFIKRNALGALCGYVVLPQGHVAFGLPDEEIDADVHGGLTYARRNGMDIIPLDGQDVWVIGFDAAHCFDIVPYMDYRGYEDAEYRNIAYMTNEVKKLAEQMRAMGPIQLSFDFEHDINA